MSPCGEWRALSLLRLVEQGVSHNEQVEFSAYEAPKCILRPADDRLTPISGSEFSYASAAATYFCSRKSNPGTCLLPLSSNRQSE